MMTNDYRNEAFKLNQNKIQGADHCNGGTYHKNILYSCDYVKPNYWEHPQYHFWLYKKLHVFYTAKSSARMRTQMQKKSSFMDAFAVRNLAYSLFN